MKTAKRINHKKNVNLAVLKSTLLLFVLTIGSTLFSQEPLPPYKPCPTFSETTEFCFENTSLFASNCERTICITYLAKEDKRDELANCVRPAGPGYCITLGVDEMGCIDLPHPPGEISDWFDINITIRMTEDGETILLDHVQLNHTIESQSPLTWYESGGCDDHHTIIQSLDGRYFIIGGIYL